MPDTFRVAFLFGFLEVFVKERLVVRVRAIVDKSLRSLAR